MDYITELKQTPFGTSLESNVLWKEMAYLENKHKEYVLSVYNAFCTTISQLYKHKILGRETIGELLYKDCINKVDKYLTGYAYTYFCNIMKICMKKHKRKDKKGS